MAAIMVSFFMFDLHSDKVPHMTLRLRLYEFLATPAHIWLMCMVRLCAMKFEFYSEEEDADAQ